MHKLFLTLCFLMPFAANAAVIPVASIEQAKIGEPTVVLQDRTNMFDNFSQDDWGNFLAQRFQTAIIEVAPEGGEQGFTSVIEPQDLIKENMEDKSLFEAMYEDAIKRASATQDETAQEADFLESYKNIEVPKKQRNFPTILIDLPVKKDLTEVPAMPHIPYSFSNIQVLSSGDILVEENIFVINNKTKAYEKKLAKFIYNRKGQAQKQDYEIIEFAINKKPVEYVKKENLRIVSFQPKQALTLPAGVYEYNLKYVIKNNLSSYENFDELLLNVNGYNNLLIARAASVVTFPKEFKLIAQNGFLEFGSRPSVENIAQLRIADNTTAFVAKTPILPTLNMFIVNTFEKGNLLKPSFSKMFWNYFNTHADAIFAILGFAVILLAYLLSLKTIDTKAAKQKISIKKTAPMMRYLLKGTCDVVSLGAFLLELFKKNIIDITKNDDTVLLIKKTDNISSLSNYEKKTLKELFVNKESVLSITSYNMLKLRRAMQKLNLGLKTKLKLFVYALNSRYLMFSFAMLLISMLAIASSYSNQFLIFAISVIISASFVASNIMFFIKTKHKYFNYLIKIASVLISIFLFLLLSNFIDNFAVFFIFASIITIFVFSIIFTKRSGLLQNYIKEIESYQDQLEKRSQSTYTAKEFVAQQASIFALDLSKNINNNKPIENFYKLDLLEEVSTLFARKK